MSAKCEAPRRAVASKVCPDVTNILLLEYGRPERSICLDWKNFKIAARVFGAEKELALLVNADMNRGSHSRLTIQQRQISSEPIDRISAHASRRSRFISRVQMSPGRIESKPGRAGCRRVQSTRRQRWSDDLQ